MLLHSSLGREHGVRRASPQRIQEAVCVDDQLARAVRRALQGLLLTDLQAIHLCLADVDDDALMRDSLHFRPVQEQIRHGAGTLNPILENVRSDRHEHRVLDIHGADHRRHLLHRQRLQHSQEGAARTSREKGAHAPAGIT